MGNLSELEVYERLDFSTLHLDNQVDNCHHEQSLTYQRQPGYEANTTLFPVVGHKMQRITQQHEGEHHTVASNQLGEHLGREMKGYLTEHLHTGSKVVMAEENPAEANKMEGNEYRQEATPPMTFVCLVATQQRAVGLMECQCHAM